MTENHKKSIPPRKQNCKNGSFIIKGGKCFIQAAGHKGEKDTALFFFERTEIGQKWKNNSSCL